MQKLTISGMVAKEPELRKTQGGDDVLSITVVCDNGKDSNGQRRDGTFYDCSLWGKRAGSLAPHIRKGQFLALFGRPTCREYNGKAYIGMSVDDLSFCGEKPQRDGGSEYTNKEPSDSGYGAGGSAMDDMSDEIPFAPEFRI